MPAGFSSRLGSWAQVRRLAEEEESAEPQEDVCAYMRSGLGSEGDELRWGG